MKYVMVCDYEGDRASDPLKEFGGSEAFGPFDSYQELIDWEPFHRGEGCVSHSVCPILEPSDGARWSEKVQ